MEVIELAPALVGEGAARCPSCSQSAQQERVCSMRAVGNPPGPSRSSRISRTSRVKETRGTGTALFSLPTPVEKTARADTDGSLYLAPCGTMLRLMINWGMIDRWFRGPRQTECQHGSSCSFTCTARTVARAPEPAFRKAGHDRRLL